MRPADKFDVVLLQELVDDVVPEREAYAPVVVAPPLVVLLGVAPQEVAQEALVRNLGRPVDLLYFLEGLQVGTQPPVHAQDLGLHQGGDGDAVEAADEPLVQPVAVPPLALVVEAVDLVHVLALVVAPQQEEVVGVLQLEGEQQADRLDGLLAPVDVVPQEQVVALRRGPADVEQVAQVAELAVDVAHYLDGRPELQQAALPQEGGPAFRDEVADFGLRQQLVRDFRCRRLHQFFYYFVQIYFCSFFRCFFRSFFFLVSYFISYLILVLLYFYFFVWSIHC